MYNLFSYGADITDENIESTRIVACSHARRTSTNFVYTIFIFQHQENCGECTNQCMHAQGIIYSLKISKHFCSAKSKLISNLVQLHHNLFPPRCVMIRHSITKRRAIPRTRPRAFGSLSCERVERPLPPLPPPPPPPSSQNEIAITFNICRFCPPGRIGTYRRVYAFWHAHLQYVPPRV